MEEKNPLKYTDEQDKSYGIAGMAVAVMAYDCEDMLVSVSMDEPAGHNIIFGSGFSFNGNPRLSAKITWTEMLRHFRMATGLLVANAICRQYVRRRRRLPDDMARALRDAVHNCGAADEVQLDADEIDAILQRNLEFFDRMFRMRAVHETTGELAAELMQRRTFSAAELADRIAPVLRLL